jgi:4-carboxymuconolactone decarboxylase
MAASERNHDELFPGQVPALAVSDPELVEVFDNFAFDEVLSYGGLDTRTRLMVQLASMIASQALAEYLERVRWILASEWARVVSWRRVVC